MACYYCIVGFCDTQFLVIGRISSWNKNADKQDTRCAQVWDNFPNTEAAITRKTFKTVLYINIWE